MSDPLGDLAAWADEHDAPVDVCRVLLPKPGRGCWFASLRGDEDVTQYGNTARVAAQRLLDTLKGDA